MKNLENDEINVDDEELMKTIKMEPILEHTIISEEPLITQKKKRNKITDIVLVSIIVLLVIIFAIVIIKVK